MFGISWAELFVILLVAVLVIPARMWPDVASFLARLVNAVRSIVWKVTDVSENIKQQIEQEQPIDDLIRTTTDEVLEHFSDVLPKRKPKKTSRKTKENV
jgi:Sec-independent protein translocase protein TatA